MKLFSVQLNNRHKNPGRFDCQKLKNSPSINQWLEVVGLSTLSVQVCIYLTFINDKQLLLIYLLTYNYNFLENM